MCTKIIRDYARMALFKCIGTLSGYNPYWRTIPLLTYAGLPSLPHLAGDSRILEPSAAHPPRH